MTTESNSGLQLRNAREAAGLSQTEVAEKLKLRVGLIAAMESNDFSALGAPVFARGYVTSYARLLGLPSDVADALFPREEVTTAAPLHTSTKISHSRFLIDRYARRLVYVALTASIVVPVILLATRESLPNTEALLTSLDAPIQSELTTQQPSESLGTGGFSEPAGPPAAVLDQPVMASLTPFYTPRLASPVVAPASESSGLVLDMSGQSWVEVTGTSGKRILNGLLDKGERHVFEQGQVSHVLLGNADGVKVLLNGQEVDLSPYRRANVVRFAVSSDGILAPPRS